MSADGTTAPEFTEDNAVFEMLNESGIVEAEQANDDTQEEYQEAEQDSQNEEPEGYETEEHAEYDDNGEDFEAEGDGEEQTEQGEQSDSSDNFVEINGEKIPLEELKAGYFRQADYTRKTSELAEERKRVAALEGFGNIMASDPVKAAQIAAIMRGEQPPQPEAQQDQRPDDAFEAMRWDLKQEVLQELAPQLQQVNTQTTELAQARAQEQFLAPFRQDPMFADTMKEMNTILSEKVATEGMSAANEYYARVDNDPQFWASEFQVAKSRVAAKANKKPPVPKKKGSPALADTASGNGKKTQKQKARQREINALREGNADAIFDVLANNGDFGDVLG